MSVCRNDCLLAGGAYPKSCPTCGLGGSCTSIGNKTKHLAYHDQKMIIKHVLTRDEIIAEEKRLQEQLAEIRKTRSELEARERKVRNQIILDNKDSLLKVIQHSRTSCADDNQINGFGSVSYVPRCERCALLQLEEWNMMDYDMTLQLRFTQP
jgi:hypothetical protein